MNHMDIRPNEKKSPFCAANLQAFSDRIFSFHDVWLRWTRFAREIFIKQCGLWIITIKETMHFQLPLFIIRARNWTCCCVAAISHPVLISPTSSFADKKEFNPLRLSSKWVCIHIFICIIAFNLLRCHKMSDHNRKEPVIWGSDASAGGL